MTPAGPLQGGLYHSRDRELDDRQMQPKSFSQATAPAPAFQALPNFQSTDI